VPPSSGLHSQAGFVECAQIGHALPTDDAGKRMRMPGDPVGEVAAVAEIKQDDAAVVEAPIRQKIFGAGETSPIFTVIVRKSASLLLIPQSLAAENAAAAELRPKVSVAGTAPLHCVIELACTKAGLRTSMQLNNERPRGASIPELVRHRQQPNHPRPGAAAFGAEALTEEDDFGGQRDQAPARTNEG
jgi:hypothetical protein